LGHIAGVAPIAAKLASLIAIKAVVQAANCSCCFARNDLLTPGTHGRAMTPDTVARLIERLVGEAFTIDNIAFGMGGGLLQLVNRDTLRFAMKANAMRNADGVWQDVAKAPATDPTKASKAGRQAVMRRDGRLSALPMDEVAEQNNLLVPVWRDGVMLIRHSFDELRAKAA
jgi:nicotinamide phosphoribosyltransferase